MQNLLGGEQAVRGSRTADIYADSAYAVLTRDSRGFTGQTLLCEDVLVESGVEDLSHYNVAGREAELIADLYVDATEPPTV